MTAVNAGAMLSNIAFTVLGVVMLALAIVAFIVRRQVSGRARTWFTVICVLAAVVAAGVVVVFAVFGRA